MSSKESADRAVPDEGRSLKKCVVWDLDDTLWEGVLLEGQGRQLRRGVFTSVASLKNAITSYLDARNADAKPFVWTADADLILGRVKRACLRIAGTGH